MNWLKNLKITNKIFFSLLIGVISCLFISFWGIINLKSTNDIIVSLRQNDLKIIQELNDLTVSFNIMDKYLIEKISTTDNNKINEYNYIIESKMSKIENQIVSIKDLFKSEKGKHFYSELEKKWQIYVPEFQEIKALSNSTEENKILNVKKHYDLELLPKTIEFISFLEKVVDFKHEVVNNHFDNSQKEYYQNILRTIILNIFIISFFLIVGIYIGNIIKKPIIQLKKELDKVTEGDLPEKIEYKYNDEILDVVKSLNLMIDSIKKSKHNNELQNWLKDGLNNLSLDLSEQKDLISLSNKAISYLARYLNSGMGALYLFDKENSKLYLTGSYAFNFRDSVSNEYSIKEGLVGQVAFEKQTIILKNIQRKEKDINTGLIIEAPISIFAMPLIYENELCGVIELSTINLFNEIEHDFINQSNKIISTMINSLQQSEKVKKLLQISEIAKEKSDIIAKELSNTNIELEEQKKYLEEQGKKMKEANIKMEQQKYELEQSSEEMRQTNVKMHEQQQELAQQSEELNQINKKLVEQQDSLKEEKERINRINLDLIEAQEELNEKAKQLEQSSQYKSEFLANMSHELRTPLNSVILLSQLLAKNKKQNLQEEEVEKLNVINKAGKDLLNLINDILDLSKIEAGKLNIEIRDFNISNLLHDQKEYFNSLASEKGLDLILENDLNDNLVIKSDSHRIAQILRNFISNAIKFTQNGSITLKLSNSNIPDKPLKFSVIDTGFGIPKDKQKLVFDAFSQADGSTTRLFGGTGLGLSISLNLAKLLGGYITLESDEGKGSNFSLILPYSINENDLDLNSQINQNPLIIESKNIINDKKAEENEQKVKLVKEIKDDRKNITKDDKTVLIVEDDSDFAETISFIAKDLGFKTIISGTFTNGMEMVKKYIPTCIILDLGLPDKNGMELLNEVKSTQELRHIPIHIVSGDDTQRLKAKKNGAIGFQTKPALEDDLILILQNMTKDIKEKDKIILIVEDNEFYKKNIMEIFSDKGLKIDEASTEKEAIKKIDSKLMMQ
jgi:signal transduction histidine kinase/DNA-binding response OmpR family regulator/HAMP domain-containing protein